MGEDYQMAKVGISITPEPDVPMPAGCLDACKKRDTAVGCEYDANGGKCYFHRIIPIKADDTFGVTCWKIISDDKSEF